MLLGWVIAGCASVAPDRFLVVDGRAGAYDLVEADIPELSDPRRMHGDLGDGSVGGYIDLETLEYIGGGPLDVRFTTADGVGIPHTDDGLVLWTYYHTLSVFRGELEGLGVDVEPVFPVPFAYQPTIGGAVYTAMNAAYAGSGVHMFALLADTTRSDLPLAANPGVIRHEFGHALFQLIVAGSVAVPAPTDSRALNEGFADMLATLSLDDPRFIELSLPQFTSRRVDEDASTTDAAPISEDPYSRGTVYASLAWDVRARTDADFALQTVVASLAEWAAGEDWAGDEAAMDKWARIFATNAIEQRPELEVELCGQFVARFPDALLPAACP